MACDGVLEVEPTAAAADFAWLLVVVALLDVVVLLVVAATTLTVTEPSIVPSDDVTVSVSDSTVLSVTWNVATPFANVMLLGTVTLVSDEATVAVPV
jgi:hypothetical protein